MPHPVLERMLSMMDLMSNRWALLVWLIPAAGCLAQDFVPPPVAGQPFDPSAVATACSVADTLLVPKCLACHYAGGQSPTLTADGVKALVDIESLTYPGRTQVVSGDPQASLLYRKIAGIQGPSEGGRMPLGASLDTAAVAFVARWIEEGAVIDCVSDPNVQPERHHPIGFAEPSVHGVELELGAQDCRQCHGATLEGGVGPSCDGCHQPEWRTTCTFCHGGDLNETGAPPRDLGIQHDPTMASFRAHTSHVGPNNHVPFDCTQCHVKPENPLSLGHVFDDTPGRAEVKFAQGLSPAGTYAGNGSCGNLYCHGNGQVTGSYSHDRGKPDCSGCHAGPAASDRWDEMSGEHDKHLGEGLGCQECHSGTVNAAGAIVGLELHVNGRADVVLPDGMTRSNGTCSGTCHGEDHDLAQWSD